MKRLLIGMTSLAAVLSSSAFAADLAPKMYTKAPPPVVAVSDWTGFYIGGNVGYSWGRSSTTQSFSDAVSGTVLGAASTKFDLNGVIGGGQAGYNWQKDNWVFGLEGDIQGSGEKGNTNAVCPGGSAAATTLAGLSSACAVGHLGDTAPSNVAAFPVTSNLSEKIEWFGTVRGRVGPTITPTILVYATGGLAYGQVRPPTRSAAPTLPTQGDRASMGGPSLRRSPRVLATPARGSDGRWAPVWKAWSAAIGPPSSSTSMSISATCRDPSSRRSWRRAETS